MFSLKITVWGESAWKIVALCCFACELSVSYCGVLDHDIVFVLRPEICFLLLCCQDVLHLPHHAV